LAAGSFQGSKLRRMLPRDFDAVAIPAPVPMTMLRTGV